MLSKSEVLRRAPVCVRWGIPWERGRPARTRLVREDPRRGKKTYPRSYTKDDEGPLRAPAWLPPITPPLRGNSAVMRGCPPGSAGVPPAPYSSGPPGSAGVPPAPYSSGPPGSAGVPPAPYSCKQPAIHGHSLAKRTEPAFTGISSIVPGFVRARRPRSQVVLCGRDARAPRWSLFTSRIASTARMVREIGAVHQVANEVWTHGKLAQGIGLEIDAVRAWPNATLMAVTTIKSTYSLEVESVGAGGVGMPLDVVEVRSVAAGSCLCSVGHPLGARASRPHKAGPRRSATG